jgi:hypothetical protein
MIVFQGTRHIWLGVVDAIPRVRSRQCCRGIVYIGHGDAGTVEAGGLLRRGRLHYRNQLFHHHATEHEIFSSWCRGSHIIDSDRSRRDRNGIEARTGQEAGEWDKNANVETGQYVVLTSNFLGGGTTGIEPCSRQTDGDGRCGCLAAEETEEEEEEQTASSPREECERVWKKKIKRRGAQVADVCVMSGQ